MMGSSLVLAVDGGAKLAKSSDWLNVMRCSRLLMRQPHSFNLADEKTLKSSV